MTKHLRTFVFLTLIIIIMQPLPLAVSGASENSRPEIFAVYMGLGIEIENSMVTMYLDGTDVTEWAAVTSERISYRPLKPLEEGIHWVRVVITDPEHKLSGEKQWSFIFSVSVTDASISLDPLETPTRRHRITVSGTTIPGIEVELFVNSMHSAFTFSDFSGRFSHDGIMLDEGLNRITAIARNPITDEISREFRADNMVFLDSTPPSIENLNPGHGSTVSAPFAEIEIGYSDADGVGVNPGSILMIVDGATVIPQLVADTGCSYTPSSPLDPGRHSVIFRIADNLGNKSDRLAWDFHVIHPELNDSRKSVTDPPEIIHQSPDSVDTIHSKSPYTAINSPETTVPPTPVVQEFRFEPPLIQHPQDGAIFREPEITVSGLANRNLTVQLALDNQITYETLSDNRGNFVFMHVIIKQGLNNIKCRLTDKKGNYSRFSETIQVTYEPLLTKPVQPYIDIKQYQKHRIQPPKKIKK